MSTMIKKEKAEEKFNLLKGNIVSLHAYNGEKFLTCLEGIFSWSYQKITDSYELFFDNSFFIAELNEIKIIDLEVFHVCVYINWNR